MIWYFSRLHFCHISGMNQTKIYANNNRKCFSSFFSPNWNGENINGRHKLVALDILLSQMMGEKKWILHKSSGWTFHSSAALYSFTHIRSSRPLWASLLYLMIDTGHLPMQTETRYKKKHNKNDCGKILLGLLSWQ